MTSQNVVEELLFSDPGKIRSSDVRKALEANTGPYKNLVEFHNDLVQLLGGQKTHEGEEKRVKKLKKIQL